MTPKASSDKSAHVGIASTGGLSSIACSGIQLCALPGNIEAWCLLLAPLIATGVSFLAVWWWQRYGLEDEATAALRKKLERDRKRTKKSLKDKILSDGYREKLQAQYDDICYTLSSLESGIESGEIEVEATK